MRNITLSKIKGMSFNEFGYFFADVVLLGIELSSSKLDELSDLNHIRFDETSGGSGGSTYADTAGYEGLLGVVGDSVLIDGDIYLVQLLLKILTGNANLAQVNEHQVVIGAAGNKVKSLGKKGGSKNLGVLYDLLLISLELGF